VIQVETMIKNTNIIETEQRMALDCYNDGVEYGKKSSDSYKQAGEHFAYLKSHMKHGEYKKWLEENDIKYRSARFIVQVYERFTSKSVGADTFKDLSFNQLRELLSLREGEEDSFIEFVKNNSQDLNNLSGRAIRSLIKDYNSIGKETQVKKEKPLKGKGVELESKINNLVKENELLKQSLSNQRRCPFTIDAIIAGLMMLYDACKGSIEDMNQGGIVQAIESREYYMNISKEDEKHFLLTRQILYCHSKKE